MLLFGDLSVIFKNLWDSVEIFFNSEFLEFFEALMKYFYSDILFF